MMEQGKTIAIVVHGGAWDIPVEYHAAHRAGCEKAAAVGWEILAGGGSALDAVEQALRLLEDDPTYDSGAGSVLTAEGTVELDAGLMEGDTLRIGAVAGVTHFANPISIARRVLEGTSHHLLVGEGAERFAAAQGFERIENASLIVEREWEAYQEFLAGNLSTADAFGGHDTVGAVALDATGRLVAGNSTGGVSFSLPGRVGDAPLPAVGYYADSRVGAVACTGWGEHIMRVGMALRAVQAMEQGATAAEAARGAIRLLQERVKGKAGLIVLDAQGRVGLAHSTPFLAHAFRTSEMDGVSSGVRVGEGGD